MNKRPVFIQLWLCALLAIFNPGFALLTPLTKVHPGYDLHTIRPESFKPPATGVAFNSKNELLITTYNIGRGHNYKKPGEVFLLKNVLDNNRDNIEVTEFASDFVDPMGLYVSNDSVYVVSRGALTVLFDSDGDSKADFRKVLFKIENHGLRMWSYGPIPGKDGRIYALNSCHMKSKRPRCISDKPGLSILYSIDANGKQEIFAGGFRQPDGLEISPTGEIFATDNQGEWLPSSKLIHVKKGRYYGVPNAYQSNPSFAKAPESPPAIWFDHDRIGMSPTYPAFVYSGPYRGQMIISDIPYGGVQRIFLERVAGEYQGVIFRFSAGLEVAMNDIIEGPDSSFYMGGIGDGSSAGWGWKGKTFGLQKMVPNGKKTFEMFAIRSMKNGFEIEYSLPAGASAATASNYSIGRGGFKPGAAYGSGNMLEKRQVKVKEVQKVSETRYLLVVDPADLQHSSSLPLKSTCFYFKLSGITSAENESLWDDEAWYTLNNIGPADKVGCMDKGKEGYDATAVYDDGFRCGKTITGTSGVTQSAPSITQLGQKFLSYRSLLNEPYRIEVYNIRGNRVMDHQGQGIHGKNLDISQLKSGVYLARIYQGTLKVSSKLIIH